MAAITILAMMGASLLNSANSASRLALRRRQSAQALALANGAMDYALQQIELSSSWSGFNSRSMGAGTVSVSVAAVAGAPTKRKLISTASVTDMGYGATRRVETITDSGGMPGVFRKALASKLSFTLNGNNTITSTPVAGEGNVHSNEGVTLNGSSLSIYGAVTATGTISVSGGPKVTGGMTSGVAPMTFPEVTQELKNQSLANGTQTVSKGLTLNSPTVVLQGKINGDVTIGDSGCIVNGVVWITGDLTCTGPVTGTGTIIVDGTMDLDGRLTISATDVTNVFWISTSTADPAVVLKGNRSFKGIIYAPNGGVKISGTPELIGGVMAKSVTFNGNPNITRWTEFEENAPAVPSYQQLLSWQEF